MIPVFESVQTELAQIGLEQVKDDLTEDTSEEECALSTDVIKNRLNYLMPEVDTSKTPGLD